MCIAIYKPIGSKIVEDHLKNSFKANGDGCGFSYVDNDDKIIVEKTMSYDEFLLKFNEADDLYRDTSPFLIHFRIKTHGEVSTFNCHPFLVNEDLVFIHNGIISNVPFDEKKSDTQMFNEGYLAGLPSGWEYNDSILRLIEDRISYNKIVVMNSDRDVFILNESKGEWSKETGCWYSNYSYEVKPFVANRSGNFSYRHYGNRILYDRCDHCDKLFSENNLKYYVMSNLSCEKYCRSCSTEESEGSVDEITSEIYKDFTKCGSEYTEGVIFTNWKDPWMDTDYNTDYYGDDYSYVSPSY